MRPLELWVRLLCLVGFVYFTRKFYNAVDPILAKYGLEDAALYLFLAILSWKTAGFAWVSSKELEG